MAIAGLLVVCLLIIGCVQNHINVSSGTGTHELGPDDANSWQSSKDSQQSTDSINRLESKISGIDKSQNEIQETVNKTSQTQQDMRLRDETKDRNDPNLPRDTRKILYKEHK